MIIDESEYLAHYGILRKSGRYPWGSGSTQNQRNQSFLDHVRDLEKQGMSQVEICKAFGIVNEFGKPSTTTLRALKSTARNEQRAALISQIERMKAKGMAQTAIGRQLGIPESQVRALLAPGAKDKSDELQTTANMLKAHVADKPWGVDVGKGVENHLGIAPTKLNTAVSILKEQGYKVHNIPVKQLGTGEITKVKALYPPGTTWGDAVRNKDKIQQIMEYSVDGGKSYNGFTGHEPPIKINPNRVHITYGDEGGSKADGVIYVRPGVQDLSMGKSNYAQVRIQVGEGHYLKGMAMYKNDLPAGKDLVFNTNKNRKDIGDDPLAAMKKIEDDPDRPFGSTVRPVTDASGKHITSALNIVHEEGNWSDWSRTISTQMLSKQSPGLARQQLDVTFNQKKKEFEALKQLTNPTIRKSLLEKFGDETDSSAVHLEAAALNQNQRWHAILPIASMPKNQIYAPNYQDGERVVLIRFPHAGTFEIPELTVNNHHAEAKRLLGQAPDAVGIHHSVAERLSGADFDGDTVLVIPNNSGKVKSTPALEGLRNFNPRDTYKGYPGMKKMTDREKGIQMGDISNLITDMTLKGASREHLERAVRHSMVVIDAQKHDLNYRQSALDNGIAKLKEEYQGGARKGASTLISRATASTNVAARKPRPAGEGGAIDKETGKRVFVPTGEKNFRTGEDRTVKSARLAETEDAHTLLSGGGVGTRMERLYADHSNKLKALANDARKESVNTARASYSPAAAKTYAPQVKRLSAALKIAERNAPLERQAQIVGGHLYKMKLDANPNMSEETKKKVRGQALDTARRRTGAGKERIVISEDEWQAIQAGAISDSRLRSILNHADTESVRKLATPRRSLLMEGPEVARAKSMLAAGATRAEVAKQLGVSLTTLDNSTVAEE